MSVLVQCIANTPTSKRRYYVFQQLFPGTVIVQVLTSVSQGSAKTTDTFLLQELQPTYCRRFKVTKQAKTGGAVYWIGISTNPVDSEDSCDCPGFESHGHCKHHSAVKSIIESEKYVPPNMNSI